MDSCTDDENITYALSGTGSYSVAKIGAFRNSGLRYGARNCNITIKPPPGYSVYLQIESFKFGHSLNGSCSNYIQVSENGTMSAKLCGSYSSLPSTSFTSYENMTIVLHTINHYFFTGVEFSLIATAYKTSFCTDRYFVCYNGRCIWQRLICDSVDNCGDGSDEKPFGRSECSPWDSFKAWKKDKDELSKMLDSLNDPEVRTDWTPVDVKPFTMNPIDFNWKVTFSPDIVAYHSSHNISVGAALAASVFVILGAFIRFYCYYQCNQARRRQVLSAVTIIRARSILRPPAMNNATPPPPYETLVNDPETQPESPPEYTTVSGMPFVSASSNTTNGSVPSQPSSADKNENVSCGPPPPYEP